MTFQRDFDFSARFTEHAAEILAGTIARRRARFATVREDRRQATDLVLMSDGAHTAALRVRRHYATMYGDVTIRSHRPSGAATELEKIRDGWCDFIVYGIARWDGKPRMCQWRVIDLATFRALDQSGGAPCPTDDATVTSPPSLWPTP